MRVLQLKIRSTARALAALALMLPAACVTTSERVAYSVDDLFSAEISGHYDLRFFPARKPDLQLALGWSGAAGGAPPEPPDGRFDILALSGGGPDGAYGIGALIAMKQTGQRPDYEIVSGISTGAMMAPFVFLGPGNDAFLEQVFRDNAFAKLLGAPNYLGILSSPALYPAKGVPEFLTKTITPALLQAIAAEHATGRRLLIATANLDTNQFTVWNMGRIATLGTPQSLKLFRDVLRAAISIPGVMAPVEIGASQGGKSFTEFHSDAGLLAYFYAEPGLIPAKWLPGKNGGKRGSVNQGAARIDVILHNQVEAPPRLLEPKTLKLASASVSNLTRTAMRLLLDQAIEKAGQAKVPLRYAYVPVEWHTASSIEFETPYMRKTYDLGFRRALDGTFWEEGPRK